MSIRAVARCLAASVSSGTTSLDNKVCEIALAHLTFNPATDRQGRPVMGSYTLPVLWKLPDDAGNDVDVSKGDPRDVIVEREFKVDAEGKVVACRTVTMQVERKPGEPAVDGCSNAQPGTALHFRWVRNGTSVGGTITQRQSVHVMLDK